MENKYSVWRQNATKVNFTHLTSRQGQTEKKIPEITINWNEI